VKGVGNTPWFSASQFEPAHSEARIQRERFALAAAILERFDFPRKCFPAARTFRRARKRTEDHNPIDPEDATRRESRENSRALGFFTKLNSDAVNSDSNTLACLKKMPGKFLTAEKRDCGDSNWFTFLSYSPRWEISYVTAHFREPIPSRVLFLFIARIL